MADASITSLQNLSFPSAITKLNFSSNPITTIRGVIFPESLTALTLLSTSSSNMAAAASTTSVLTPEEVRALREDAEVPTAQSESLLEEFEVRQSDADMFEKLQLWDVSTTSTLECSDSNANPRYVDDTMLCVLSDAEFAAKYRSVVEAASSGSTGSVWGTTDASASQAMERVVLKETLDQRRSWFLIVAGALLVALAVLLCLSAFCAHLRRQVRGSSNKNRSQFEAVNPTTSRGATRFWPEREKKPQDEEVLHLLSSDTSTSEDESSLQPGIEQEAADKQLAVKTTPLGYLQQHLRRFEIAASSLKHKAVLSAGTDPNTADDHANGGSGVSASLFVYSKAVYRRKLVTLKTLYCKQNERESEVSTELWSFVEEIRLSSMLSHPHIVAFYGYVVTPYSTQHKELPHGEDVALVMEFMVKGDLNAFIQMHKRSLRQKQTTLRQRPRRANTRERMQSLVKRVSWHDEASAEFMEEEDENKDEQEQLQPPEATSNASKWSWRHSSAVYKNKLAIAIEVAQAVHYLHSFSPPLCHGNLSSRKIFLDSHWNVKLGDLTCCSALRRWSSSHKQSDVTPALMTEEGSPLRISGSSSSTGDDEIHLDMTIWTAPEVLDGRQYTEKADIYSFGVLLAQLDSYECSSAEHSIMDDTEVPMLRSDRPGIQSGDGEAPTLLRLLTLKCQAFQPEVRPTADELLRELHHIEQDMTENSSTCTTPVASSQA
ncbi:hypothetical protein BBJ28_00014235 [Nothophytophthora sp. Chile5]|nr:hypothetical protein BBJ28_00014235 [Nothophytophthora sp. Chile5]